MAELTLSWATIPQMIETQAKRLGSHTALQSKRDGDWQKISWEELHDHVEDLALALIDLGLKAGDRAAILSENRPEWAFADLSILTAGGVTVPIYTTLTTPEIEYILKDAGAHIVFVSMPELMSKLLPLQDSLDLKFILMDAPYRVVGPRVWWIGELYGLGATAGSVPREDLAHRKSQAKSESLASIIYTSGTTGFPKGVMLSHRNFISNCEGIREALPITQADSTVSFLPLCHVFERTCGYYFVLSVGGMISYAESLEKVADNLAELHPTIVTGVPRFYEKFHERVMASIHSSHGLKKKIALWALDVGKRYAQKSLRGEPIPLSLEFQYGMADRMVFAKLRGRLGGRIRFFVSGGAPLAKELAEFFYAAGIMIVEGYGLTETSPVITVNRPEKFRFGSVGLPIAHVEVRIAEDGEILARGPLVMQGYFHKPEATVEVLDQEGWFHTGDIGQLDADGFLYITDRKKDLLKTSGGKMVAPQYLENRLKNDPLIDDCVVIGDKHKYLTALIVPNLAELESYARQHGLPHDGPLSLVTRKDIIDLVWDHVQKLNQELASFEQIKKITILPEPFTIQSGELTPTMKVKRRVIAERYAAQIDAMYRE